MQWSPNGRNTIDPNDGGITLALGRQAARQVVSGHMPLWNHYEGLGSPLLGEMQSAALFPPTWLMAMRSGQPIAFALLQIIAGAGAYLFLRAFGIGVAASLACALVYEVNGVLAWLRNAIANPVCFLPWLLIFIECACRTAQAERMAGQRHDRMFNVAWGAVVAALAIYAGFPEEVYLYAFLAGIWLIFRAAGLSRRQRAILATDIAVMALAALALSSPALVTFVDFLREGELFRYGGDGFSGIWLHPAGLIQLILPYVFGAPMGSHNGIVQGGVWASTGGYVGLLPVMLGFGALALPGYRGAKLLLTGWIIVAVGASYGLPGVYQAFLAIPLIKTTAFFRFLNVSWIFCFLFLAALFIDTLPKVTAPEARRALFLAAFSGFTLALIAAQPALGFLRADTAPDSLWLYAAVGAALVLGGAVVLGAWMAPARAAAMIAVLAMIEAASWFLIPYAFHPRGGEMDYGTIAFLKSNLGFQRVAGTPGVRIGTNFGSYLGFSTLDFDDLPAPRRTVDFIRERLDPYAFPAFGAPPLTAAEAEDEVRQYALRLGEYAKAGVKYVVGRPGLTLPNAVTAYGGAAFTVYALANVRDYASAPKCTVEPVTYDRMTAFCTEPDRLTRLELYMRGWSATVNGKTVPVGIAEDTFQSVELPAGRSEIKFTFRPPGYAPARAAASIALSVILSVFAYAAFRRLPRRTRGDS